MYLSHTRRACEAASKTFSVVLHNLAAQDCIAAFFHFYLWCRVAFVPDSPEAVFARRLTLAYGTVTLCCLVLVRGELISSRRVRAWVYRWGVFALMASSYFELRWVLPAIQPHIWDMKLLAIDEILFGTTPSVVLAKYNSVPIIEWFSFFYYSYFWILFVMLVPFVLFSRGRHLQELTLGGMIMGLLGHCGYTLVPGFGPYVTLPFPEAIQGGFWWEQVMKTVASGGAMLDIFPSMHTAIPSFFAMHCFGHRHMNPYRWMWPILAFFSLNIMVATLLLRWHWGIDVIAGLLVATVSRYLAVRITTFEIEQRARDSRQPVWEPI